MRALSAMLPDIAPTDISVLLFGESGTGKEAYARLIHRMSGPNTLPLTKITCATLDSGRILRQVQECLRSARETSSTACIFLDGVEELDLAWGRGVGGGRP
jgi:DNA-binding NtrC family response regulator